MAKVRFSHLDDFVLKDDGKVGIGTSLPSAELEVIGTIKAANLKSTSGISTFTSYGGFQNKRTSYVDNITIDSGDSGTLSGEIVVGAGLTLTVSAGATTGQGSIDSLKVRNTFTPPIGFTTSRPTAPKPGSIFYNKDFRTIEYWDGNFWRQVDNVTTSSRGVCSGGWSPSPSASTSTMEVINLASQGHGVAFGTLAQAQEQAGSVSNSIRGIVAGGGPNNDNHMSYYAIASGGVGEDFGNLNTGRRRPGGLGSSTRGLICGGRAPGALSVIDYITIATKGFSDEFGDLTTGKNGPSTVSSPTHGIITNGYSQSSIDKVTIASKGDAVDVGDDMFFGGYATGGASTGTRGVWAGGYASPGASPYTMQTPSIRGIDIASGGNPVEFGTLIHRKYGTYQCGTGSHIRGFWMGGADEPNSAAAGEHIQMMNLKSGGKAEHWGDLNIARSGCTAFSDCHGGLGGF